MWLGDRLRARTHIPQLKFLPSHTNFVFPVLYSQHAQFGMLQRQAQQKQAYLNWKMMMCCGMAMGAIAPVNIQTVRCFASSNGTPSDFPKRLKHEGDLVISHDIPDHTEIEVTDGSLTIHGNVGSRVSIRFISTQTSNVVINSSGGVSAISIGGGSVFVGGGSVYINGKKIDPSQFNKGDAKPFVTPKLAFTNAGDYFSFEASAAILRISGKVGEESRIDFTSGSVDVAEIGGNSVVKTVSANVRVGSILAGTEVESTSGDISATLVAERARLKTVSGDVGIKKLHQNARVKTVSGDVTVGEVCGENSTVETVSGDITFKHTPPDSTRIHTVSGDVSGAQTSGRSKKGRQGSVHVTTTSQSGGIFASRVNATTIIVDDNENASETWFSKWGRR